MRASGSLSFLRFFSLGLLLAAVILATLQLVRFSRIRAFLPAGLIIAGVPVGGLDRTDATERLLEMYSSPVEVYYDDAVIQMDPNVIDFRLDLESMLAVADLERTQKQFWVDFWDYLWGRTEFPSQIPLSASVSEARLRAFLTDISARYDQPPESPLPIPGSPEFQPGKSGTALDIDRSLPLVESALSSIDSRMVSLPIRQMDPTRPVFQNLEVLLKQTITGSGFDGLAGVYLQDLNNNQEIHFEYLDGEDLPTNPDVAYTASSIIKVPIMVSAFRHLADDSDQESQKLLQDMIDLSGNEAADWLMDRVLDSERGPLIVSEDMETLGLESTYLAGYFSFGSPLLAVFETPANTRTDVFTDPDPYSQTTPSEIGMLLEDIYQCAQNGGSALVAAFPGEITRQECQEMNTLLLNNRLPVLLTAGLPEATPIAHKHGWVTVNGVINTIGDAGIIYSPGGNYILVVFLYHPEQLVWDPASALVTELSRAVYNYYNLPTQ